MENLGNELNFLKINFPSSLNASFLMKKSHNAEGILVERDHRKWVVKKDRICHRNGDVKIRSSDDNGGGRDGSFIILSVL